MDFGIKLTIEGYEVTTDTTPEHHSIWSIYKNLKMLDDPGTWPTTATITSGSLNVNYTITHNLSYVPLYDLYFKDLDGRMVHIPGKSLETSTVRGRIYSETVNAITVRLGHPSYTVGSDRVYSVYHNIFVDPNDPTEF
jgi:hypothetical protein